MNCPRGMAILDIINMVCTAASTKHTVTTLVLSKHQARSAKPSACHKSTIKSYTYHTSSLVPRRSGGGAKKKNAWYTLFAYALN